ncbi:MAG: ABC transporter permease [Bacteroidales bacterium]|nr:ABC transporter permease [Bacteroidales bacterium]
MKLIWKLLRQHLSIGQFVGFFFANLFGMLIVLLSLQFYEDIIPAFSGEDGVMKNTYMIVSKSISAASTLGGEAQAFTETDVREFEQQSFARRVGLFTASQYQVYGSLSMGGMGMGTDMFFESVPDDFVDSKWPEDFTAARAESLDLSSLNEVPIILPRSYLAIYNFGFAQTKNLPKLSEGVVSMIQLDLRLRGEGGVERSLKGRVVGFSTRLNTVLVPQAFMQASNKALAPASQAAPTRLIVEVNNPADDAIATFIQDHGYELEDNSLEAGRATYFLKVVAGIIMAVGLLISALSFYILMLSIYLLVQKNAEKLQNLRLIGYSPARISLPYQLLTIGMNALVLLLSFVLVFWIRGLYLERLWQMFPQLSEGAVTNTILLGFALFILVSFFNIIAIRRKINHL